MKGMRMGKEEFKRVNYPAAYDVETIEQDGTFVGYGSVFDNIDLDRDIVVRGAFKKSLGEWKKKKMLPPVVWQHRFDEPLGPHLDMHEDDTGLALKGLLLVEDVQKAREARALMKHKAVNGLSIGFITRNSKPDRERNVRLITEVELLEVSIVTMASNQEARILDVKGQSVTVENLESLSTVQELEEILREVGFSRSAAKMFMAKCKTQREAGDGDAMKRLFESIDSATRSTINRR